MAFAELECVQIESAESAIQVRKEAYLRAKGWHHTSQTVGCRWMWFRQIDGKSYGCDTDSAFDIQNTVDRRDYADAHPEEFED